MRESDAPKNVEEYVIWARTYLGFDLDEEDHRTAYDNNVTVVLAKTTDAFSGLVDFLELQGEKYLKQTGSHLFMTDMEAPDVRWIPKPYESVINKCFRQNVLWNAQFPDPPTSKLGLPNQWITPENWFRVLNDTVRTRIVCKYIDGPKFLAEQLEKFAGTDLGLQSHYDSRQKDDGYYAFHFYVKMPVKLYTGKGFELIYVDNEIQISTQLQDALNQITHLYYETNRIQQESDSSAWKWEINTNRFRIGYLSHTLHLLEAIILEARNTGLHNDSQ